MNLKDLNILLIQMGQNGKITKSIHCRLFQVHSLAFKNKLITNIKMCAFTKISIIACSEKVRKGSPILRISGFRFFSSDWFKIQFMQCPNSWYKKKFEKKSFNREARRFKIAEIPVRLSRRTQKWWIRYRIFVQNDLNIFLFINS